ncbi:C39 family peptidase [Candidatus Gracilibacteria bacterium]|nr:C39 family peptidase [Candidatus Gracilibacteria bacterium]
MKLPVPYYSQFVDIQDPFWMLRACGGTCLKMVAEYHLPTGIPNREGIVVPDILSLCNEAKERGGYDMQNGWVHDYLVNKAKELGLQAHRSEGLTNITDEIIASLDAGNPVIVSVEKRVLEQTRFHLIVIVGYEKEDNVSELVDSFKLKSNSCFYYHESESTDKERGQYRTCDVETFMNYWRGKAIFISK